MGDHVGLVLTQELTCGVNWFTGRMKQTPMCKGGHAHFQPLTDAQVHSCPWVDSCPGVPHGNPFSLPFPFSARVNLNRILLLITGVLTGKCCSCYLNFTDEEIKKRKALFTARTPQL